MSDWIVEPEFFALVRDRPDLSLTVDSPICPYCGATGELLQLKDHCETCMGSLGDHDPNHHWRSFACQACSKSFCMESKDVLGGPKNVWYVGADKELLRGVPSCYESYVYHCAKCDGGKVRRRHVNLQGQPTSCLSSVFRDGMHVRAYHTFFRCDQCGAEVESVEDHWPASKNAMPVAFAPLRFFASAG